jgi:secreted trypsin-like serine protease
MSTRALVFLAGAFLAGCGPMDDDQVEITQQPIIGGTTDNADPSVVALFVHAPGATSGSLCTGTVISSRAVLTAAHCVDPTSVGSGQVFQVIPGTTLSLANALAVSATAFDPAFNINNLTGGHDVAVVTLASPTTLTPIPFNTGTPSSTTSVRLVGYGSNSHANTGAGTKRTVTVSSGNVVISSSFVKIGTSSQQTCHGDSGGPALQVINGVERIIGVTSFGTDRSATNVCLNGGTDTRIDQYTSFINAHL